MARRGAVLAAAAAIVLVRVASAQDISFPAADVRVVVTIGDGGRAVVAEQYALTTSIDRPTFQFLADACATVGPVSASIDNRAIAVNAVEDIRQPWMLLQVDGSGAPTAVGGTLALRYDVTTRGVEAVVPIIMPAETLARAERARGARVHILVRWTGTPGAARVVMPRFAPASGSGEWESQLLAMPSAVRIDLTSAVANGDACQKETAGTTGGLEWRFGVFVGTMVIWVTAYLLWFGRRWSTTS